MHWLVCLLCRYGLPPPLELRLAGGYFVEVFAGTEGVLTVGRISRSPKTLRFLEELCVIPGDGEGRAYGRSLLMR